MTNKYYSRTLFKSILSKLEKNIAIGHYVSQWHQNQEAVRGIAPLGLEGATAHPKNHTRPFFCSQLSLYSEEINKCIITQDPALLFPPPNLL